MPKSLNHYGSTKAKSYAAYKRSMKRGKSKAKTPLDRKYKRIKSAQLKRKKVRVVRAAASRAVSAMKPLAQPKSKVLKFVTSKCRVYQWKKFTYPGTTQEEINPIDTNPELPVDGWVFRVNDIYNPFMSTEGAAGMPLETAPGFYEISRKYQKFRVIGAKLTVKFRRMGGYVPGKPDGVDRFTDDTMTLPDAQGNDVTAEHFPTAAARGTMYDPSNQDPLLAILTNDNDWQRDQFGSAIEDIHISSFEDLHQYQNRPGLKWRELKAGQGHTATFVHKFSERDITRYNSNSDKPQLNEGHFYQNTHTDPEHARQAQSPMHSEEVRVRIKPFDSATALRLQTTNPRIMMTMKLEHLVKVWEPRNEFASNLTHP